MRKKFLTSLLCGVLALTAMPFVGCSNNSDDSSGTSDSVSDSTTSVNTNSELTQVLNGFENLLDYYNFSFGNRFGEADINYDMQYVSEGKASMMVETFGDYRPATSSPIVSVSLAADGSDVDLSKLKSVTFDIFNVSDVDKKITMSMTIDGTSIYEQEYTLKPGKNSINYAPPVKYLPLLCDMTKGQALNIVFPKATVRGEPGHKFYVDNLVLNKSLLTPEAVEFTLAENEFCSFDQPYQEYIVSTQPIGPSGTCLPKLSINSDPAYCKNNTGKSLKVEMPVGSNPLNDGWPAWNFIPAFVENFDWHTMVQEEAELVFDVYSASAPMSFGCEFWCGATHSEGHNTPTIAPFGYSVNAPLETWREIRIPLKNLNAGVTETKPDLLSQNLKAIAFYYSKFDDGTRVVYFDNFRFEK